MNNLTRNLVATTVAGLGLAAATGQGADTNAAWSTTLVAPVANPIFFESPAIGNEVRPIFMQHNLNDSFLGVPTDVQVYALQFRLALTERLAFIATKDGYVEINPDGAKSLNGWADIGAGFKYALIQDEANRFLLTPGLKFEVPCGSKDVFQGNGDGEFDLFVSAAKGLGEFQLMGSAGVRLPLDGSDESSQLHYSLQLAYPACQWFKPFVALNGYTGLSNGSTPDLGALQSEGYDVINFGAGDVAGENMLVLGVGFRTSLCKCIDVGAAYEKDVTTDDGIFDDRFTVDLIWKF
jgi:hypothetical protein